MRFYIQQHRFYSGIDLHARTLKLGGDGLHRVSRECRRKNCPAAEDVCRILNRSDATTDQQNLSPSAVRLLTDRGHIWVLPYPSD
jgi:hypothetical protein